MNGPEPESKEPAPLVAIVAIAATLVFTIGFVLYRTVVNVAAAPAYVVSSRGAERVAASQPPQTREQQRARRERAAATHRDAAPAVVARHVIGSANASPMPTARPSLSPAPSPTVPTRPSPAANPTVAAKASASLVPFARAEKRRAARGDATQAVANAPVSARAASILAPLTPAPVATATTEPTTPASAPTAAAVALAAPESLYAPDRIVEARVRQAVSPEFPSDPNLAGLRVTTIVLVTIGPKGRVVRTAIEKSSGYGEFDRAATTAARQSDYYAPKIDGRAATETYRMVYDFR